MLPARTGFRMLSLASQPILRAIGRVVGAEVLADAAAFFQAFAGMEGGFRERAEMVASLLQADTTRFVLVTSPRRETVEEAAWFADQLERPRIRGGCGRHQPRPSRLRRDHGRRGAAARSAAARASRVTTKRRCGATLPSSVTLAEAERGARRHRFWRAHPTER